MLLNMMLRQFLQRRQWHHNPVLLPGKSHGQRSLVGCSPWGREESDRLRDFTFTFHFSLSCIGEGNGNPLQCSCLENPRDGGAWLAAVYGVAQSRTWLKWLSSSSSKTVLHNGHYLIQTSILPRLSFQVCPSKMLKVKRTTILNMAEGNEKLLKKNGVKKLVVRIIFLKDYFDWCDEWFISGEDWDTEIFTETSLVV